MSFRRFLAPFPTPISRSRDSRPQAADASTGGGDLAFDNEIRHINSLLWDGADVFKVASSAPEDYGVLAVELHKGGYATISIAAASKIARLDMAVALAACGGRTVHPDSGSANGAVLHHIHGDLRFLGAERDHGAAADDSQNMPSRFRTTSIRKRQLPERGPHEVRELTRSLNRMQARISKMIAARAHVLAAVSHDLRTIITRLEAENGVCVRSKPSAADDARRRSHGRDAVQESAVFAR